MSAPAATAQAAPPKPMVRYKVASSMAERGDEKPIVMHWGPPLAGKTSGALSYPGPFFIYFDPNRATLRKHPRPVPYVQVTDRQVMRALAEDVRARRMSVIAQSLGFADYQVGTIVVDSCTFQSNQLDRWLRAEGVKGEHFWDLKKQALREFYGDITSAALPREGTEHYGVVVTAHEKTIKNEDGAVIAVTNHVTGGFGDELFQYMDTILLFGIEQQTNAEGEVLRGTLPKHVVYTQAPDRFRRSVGDRTGGGRFGKLPARLSLAEGVSLYDELARYWYGAGADTTAADAAQTQEIEK